MIGGLVLTASLGANASASLKPPQDLRADAPYGERIDLHWETAGAEVEGYRVARRCGGGRGQEVRYCERGVLGAQVKSYRDLDVEPGRSYAYRVEAIRGQQAMPAYASVSTPAVTGLPRDSEGEGGPIYFEPQGAWALGEPSSLSSVRTVRIGHNLSRDEDLGILLQKPGPADPKASCRAHSLIGRLRVAGYKTARLSAPSSEPPARTAEVYFLDLTRVTEGDQWIREKIPEFEAMGDEGYALRAEFVAPGSLRIFVGARTPKGLFRGGMTVQRLLVDDGLCDARKQLEPVVVLDYPDHPLRGANPHWLSMTANRTQVTEEALDMLDGLARSGATEVDWGHSWAAQEAYSWDKTGARAAAAVQRAAAERFMTVKYVMGFSAIAFGTTDKRHGGPDGEARVSLSQSVYGDGLAVVDEPFAWIESEPGRLKAQAQRGGRRLTRGLSDWRPGKCSGSASWRFHEGPKARAGSDGRWTLSGGSSGCTLSQDLAALPSSFPDGYLLSARVRVSDGAMGVQGSFELEVTTQAGMRRWAVSLPEDDRGRGWHDFVHVIPASEVNGPVLSARLRLKGSVGQGQLEVDHIGLYARSLAPFRMTEGPREQGWSFHSRRSGLAWDRRHGRTDSLSFRVEGSGQKRSGDSPPLASLRREVLLEEGLYLIGAWMQVESEGTSGSGKGAFSLNADVKVELFSDKKGKSDSRLLAEYLSFPRSVSRGQGRWIYYVNVFRLNQSEAERVRSMKVQLRAFNVGQKGSYWIDDIALTRLDGDLRNVLGAVQAPRLTRSKGEVYVEGVDYAVCQVGASDSECATPGNYTDLLPGGLTSSYEIARPAFEIRWLREEKPADPGVQISYDVGAQYRSVSPPVVGWDGQVYTPGSLNFCQFDRVAAGIHLDELFSRFLGGYRISDFPRKGEDYVFKAESVTWSVSEVKGVNRSVACRGPDGRALYSNADLFAQVVNRAFSLAQEKSAETRFVLWADMFDPFHNGGDLDFQVRYGGVPGRSACSFAPSRLPSMCADEVARVSAPILESWKPGDEGIVMQPWTYYPDAVRRMVAISSWYQGLGVTSQVLSGSDPVNVEDWAAIAHTFDGVKGVVSNRYLSKRYDGRSGVLGGLQAFWNHDWKLLYLHDHEDASSSYYTIPWPFDVSVETAGMRRDRHGKCSAGSEKFKKNNDGGLCLVSSSDSDPSRVALSGIPVHEGRTYRVDVLAQPRARFSGSSGGPTIEVVWSTGQRDSVVSSDLIFDAKRRGRKQGFNRYRASFEAPAGAKAMKVDLSFVEPGVFKAVDDILFFESLPACFEGCSGQD